jgi:formate hydrogenlyase subunit 3/multisubunit Na+/H+ antiporter MnhD subunit
MSKDQAYGGLILAASLVIAVLYIVAFFSPYLGMEATLAHALREWAVAIPVFLFVVAVLVICMWIGWTMLTTPPPAPLEAEAPPPTPTEEEKTGT